MTLMRERFDELRGQAERYGERCFIALTTLDSGIRYGIIDDLRWALVESGELCVFQAGNEKRFVELLEHARADFDAQLESAATALGFPGEELSWSFPAVDLVRAMLATGLPHFTRIALMWLLPTELRELRPEILRASQDSSLTEPVRALAKRLVVPER